MRYHAARPVAVGDARRLDLNTDKAGTAAPRRGRVAVVPTTPSQEPADLSLGLSPGCSRPARIPAARDRELGTLAATSPAIARAGDAPGSFPTVAPCGRGRRGPLLATTLP